MPPKEGGIDSQPLILLISFNKSSWVGTDNKSIATCGNCNALSLTINCYPVNWASNASTLIADDVTLGNCLHNYVRDLILRNTDIRKVVSMPLNDVLQSGA